MWWIYLRGVRSDLWRMLPPKLAQRILAGLLSESLGILTVRYTQIYPSQARSNQFTADITALLLATSEFLLSVSNSPTQLLHPLPTNKLAQSIHVKCRLLLASLILVGCPISTLCKVLKSTSTKSPVSASLAQDQLADWLVLVRPGLFPHFSKTLNDLPTGVAIYLQAAILAAQPEPSWPVVVRTVIMKDYAAAILIMTQLGERSAHMGNTTVNPASEEHCGQFMCKKKCCAAPGTTWMWKVSSAVLYTLLHGVKHQHVLTSVLQPFLKRNGNWACMDQQEVWNCWRPVWYYGLVETLKPYFLPAVQGLLEEYNYRTDRNFESQVTEAVKYLLAELAELAWLIPASFHHLCQLIDSMMPSEIHPTCKSAAMQLIASSVYTVLNSPDVLSPPGGEQLDQKLKHFLIAIGERLCSLKFKDHEESIHAIEEGLSSGFSEETEGAGIDGLTEDYSLACAEVTANSLLMDPQGQKSLKVLHRFLCANVDWLQTSLGVSPVLDAEPADSRYVPPRHWTAYEHLCFNPAKEYGKIGVIKFEQLVDYPHNWELLVTFAQTLGLPLFTTLLSHRSQFSDMEYLDKHEQSMTEYLRNRYSVVPRREEQ